MTTIEITIDRFFEKNDANKAYELSRKLVDWLPETNWYAKMKGYNRIAKNLIDIDIMSFLDEIELMNLLADKYECCDDAMWQQLKQEAIQEAQY